MESENISESKFFNKQIIFQQPATMLTCGNAYGRLIPIGIEVC